MSSVVALYGMKELTDERETTFKVEWLDPKLNIGIEIEVEQEGNTGTDPDSLNLWTMKSDGSLRQGQEFVLSRPMKGDALSAAIEEFFHYNRVHRSPTSGTHIHVDMRDKATTLDVAKTMAGIIMCVEPAIFGMFAEGREWSGYTNPITSLPDQASFSMFGDKASPKDFTDTFSPLTREYKYYGFNVLPLGRYGSVEFRYFPTAESAEELIDWVQFCMAVKIAAVQLNQRRNLKYYISTEASWEEFLGRFFPQWRERMAALLPQREVYVRYKHALTRFTKGRTAATYPTAAGTANPLAQTRFKKFFAVKVHTEEGKPKLVYDFNSLLDNVLPRVFDMNLDPEWSNSEVGKRDGDWLIANYTLYKYDGGYDWIEVLRFNLDAHSIMREDRPMSREEFESFRRGMELRLSGRGGVYAFNVAALTSHRDRFQQVADIISQHYARFSEGEGVPDEAEEVYIPPTIPYPPAYEHDIQAASEQIRSVRALMPTAMPTAHTPRTR